MKITKLNICEIRLPLKRIFRTAQREASEVLQLEVSVHSDNGCVGVGAASATTKVTGETLASITTIINNFIFPLIEGLDIRYLNKILHIIHTSVPNNYSAKAALDMAIHDLYCQCYSMPLYAYTGVNNTSLKTSLTISIDSIENMCKEASDAIQQGFHSLKIKMGKDYKHDLLVVDEICRVIPSNITLRLDANQGWSRKEAVNIIRLLGKYDNIELIEQPVIASDIAGLKWIKNRVDIPIMADESAFSFEDTLNIVKNDAADIINIKLQKCGGISPAIKIAHLCEGAGVEVMLGCMMEGASSLLYSIIFAFSQQNLDKIDLDSLYFLTEFSLPNYIQYEQGNILLNLL